MAIFEEFINRLQIDDERPENINIQLSSNQLSVEQCRHVRAQSYKNIDLELYFHKDYADNKVHRILYRINSVISTYKDAHNVIIDLPSTYTLIQNQEHINDNQGYQTVKLYNESNLSQYYYKLNDIFYSIIQNPEVEGKVIFNYLGYLVPDKLDHEPTAEDYLINGVYDITKIFRYKKVYYIAHINNNELIIEKWYLSSDIINRIFNKYINIVNSDAAGSAHTSPLILRNGYGVDNITAYIEYGSETILPDVTLYSTNRSQPILINRTLSYVEMADWDEYEPTYDDTVVYTTELIINNNLYRLRWTTTTSTTYPTAAYEARYWNKKYTSYLVSEIPDELEITYDDVLSKPIDLQRSTDDPISYIYQVGLMFQNVMLNHKYEILLLELDGKPGTNTTEFVIPPEILDNDIIDTSYIWSKSWELNIPVNIENESGYKIDTSEQGILPADSQFKLNLTINNYYMFAIINSSNQYVQTMQYANINKFDGILEDESVDPPIVSGPLNIAFYYNQYWRPGGYWTPYNPYNPSDWQYPLCCPIETYEDAGYGVLDNYAQPIVREYMLSSSTYEVIENSEEYVDYVSLKGHIQLLDSSFNVIDEYYEIKMYKPSPTSRYYQFYYRNPYTDDDLDEIVTIELDVYYKTLIIRSYTQGYGESNRHLKYISFGDSYEDEGETIIIPTTVSIIKHDLNYIKLHNLLPIIEVSATEVNSTEYDIENQNETDLCNIIEI